VQQPENGFIHLQHYGAAVAFFCHNGFTLAGNRNTYCNGTHWDRALGVCRGKRFFVFTAIRVFYNRKNHLLQKPTLVHKCLVTLRPATTADGHMIPPTILTGNAETGTIQTNFNAPDPSTIIQLCNRYKVISYCPRALHN
jgi:hypothetical protein